MVVIDHQPGVVWPRAEVFAEDLGKRLDVLRRRWERSQVGRRRTSQSGTIEVALLAIPNASAATSVADDRAVNQAARRPSRATHCSARVVLPYPAGAMSIRTRALVSSRSANNLGRSTILRLRIRTSESVAVVALS